MHTDSDSLIRLESGNSISVINRKDKYLMALYMICLFIVVMAIAFILVFMIHSVY